MINKNYILNKIKTNKATIIAYGVQNVGLFGSYIRGEQTEHSDIDILIVFEPEKESFDNYMALYDIFEKLFNNKKIELVTKNSLSPHIGPKILNEVVYA